jgi:hypothetical protein
MAIRFLATPVPDAAAAPQFTFNPGSSDLARGAGGSSYAAGLPTARALPDPAICRATTAGLDGYANCLVGRPSECPHALGFGYGFFCRHPQRNEIVMRTATRGQ